MRKRSEIQGQRQFAASAANDRGTGSRQAAATREGIVGNQSWTLSVERWKFIPSSVPDGTGLQIDG